MGRFFAHTITPDNTLGEQLQAVRVERGLKLKEISRRLKLPLKYLEALEKGDWRNLPEGDYAKYFLRSYADHLQISAGPLLKQYDSIKTKVFRAPVNSTPITVHQMSVPASQGRRLILGLLVVGIVLYLIATAWRTFLPPSLNLVSPLQDLITENATINVSGLADVGIKVTVNGEAVEVSDQGKFNEPVALHPGLNTITVVAKKTYSRPVIITRQILFNPPPSPTSVPVIP